MIITGSRVTYAMAKDNAFFSYIGKVNVKYGTPQRAIIINAVWAIALIILGNFNKLLFFTGVLVWLFFALVAGGLFILRYKFPDIERSHKIWGYPLVPVIFILVCIALILNTVIYYTFPSIIGLCLAMAGIPVFIISQKKKALLSSNK
jgi:amino acid transporter